jgi:hypothetical protein
MCFLSTRTIVIRSIFTIISIAVPSLFIVWLTQYNHTIPTLNNNIDIHILAIILNVLWILLTIFLLICIEQSHTEDDEYDYPIRYYIYKDNIKDENEDEESHKYKDPPTQEDIDNEHPLNGYYITMDVLTIIISAILGCIVVIIPISIDKKEYDICKYILWETLFMVCFLFLMTCVDNCIYSTKFSIKKRKEKDIKNNIKKNKVSIV